MKTYINFEGKKATIELTPKQLKNITNQLNNIKTVEDINGYVDACNILDIKQESNPSDYTKLTTIIEAANFIDNNSQPWKPVFNNIQRNYLPYLRKNGSSWSLYDVRYFGSLSHTPAGLYYKEESTAKLIANKFMSTHYTQVFG